MAMKTRSNATTAQSEYAGTPNPENAQSAPLTLLTLPDNISEEAWITTFTNDPEGSSLSDSPRQYVCCPETAKILEITEVNTAKDAPRSWLLAPGEDDDDTEGSFIDRGYITQSSALYIATPVDPLFLLLPILVPARSSERKNEKNFLTLDDYEDMLIMRSPEWKFVLQHEKLRLRILQRLRCVCDKTMAGDEEMYRLSIANVAKQILAKARRIVTHGLPHSLEQEFVQRVLQIPTTQSDKDLSGNQTATVDNKIGSEQDRGNKNLNSDTVKEDTAYTEKESRSINDIDELIPLQRLRTAINLVLSYTEPHIREQILSAIKDDDSINFTSLDSYLAEARELRQEATALRALSDNISIKRPATDEMLEAKAEKKRKKEEDEKKKKLQSRGVKDLKKVNTSGMMKLNSFFRKGG